VEKKKEQRYEEEGASKKFWRIYLRKKKTGKVTEVKGVRP